MSEYFKRLGKKIEVDVPHNVDEQILATVADLNKKEKGMISTFLPYAVAASLVIVAYKGFEDKLFPTPVVNVAEILEEQELLEDIELLDFVAAQEVDVSDLSDEDWDVLLTEVSSDI